LRLGELLNLLLGRGGLWVKHPESASFKRDIGSSNKPIVHQTSALQNKDYFRK
jgi:hypothetical protein